MKRLSALLLALYIIFTLGGCAGEKPENTPASSETDPPAASAEPTPTPTPEPTPEPTPTPPPPPTVATIAVCGDTLVHNTIYMDAWDKDKGEYDFIHTMKAAQPYVSAADYAIVNLETTLPGTEPTGYPRFRTPDALAANLKEIGFDMCLTANNHCMDAGFAGLSRTLDVLDEAGLKHVGTSRNEDEYNHNMVIDDVGGIRVAFLGYTYGTNGLPLKKDAPWSVNLFNIDYMTTLNTPDTEKLISDLDVARDSGADMICVLIHWGVEYRTKQNKYQEKIADLLIENGADIVLGGHSHVLQPCQMRTVTDKDGEEHTGFVCFSLGNFFSNQNKEDTDLTTVLTVEITRDNETGESMVTDWTYVPMVMVNWGKGKTDQYMVVDAYALLDEGGSGIDKRLQTSIERIHKILGPEHDIRYVPPETEEQKS